MPFAVQVKVKDKFRGIPWVTDLTRIFDTAKEAHASIQSEDEIVILVRRDDACSTEAIGRN